MGQARVQLSQMVPVPLWHVVHSAALADPALHCDRVIKPLPEGTVELLVCFRIRHSIVLRREDRPSSRPMQQKLPVGPVINQESVVPVAVTKMRRHQKQDIIVRLDLRSQHPIADRKADKLLVLMRLTGQIPHCLGQGRYRFICQHGQNPPSMPHSQPDKAIEQKLPLRMTAMPSKPDHLPALVCHSPPDPGLHPFRPGGVSLYLPHPVK